MAVYPPPLVIAPEAFLALPSGYAVSPARLAEARRQSWQLLRVLTEQGRVDHVVAVCDWSGAGGSAWIAQHAASEGARTAFYDDRLESTARRTEWLESLTKLRLDLPCEVVVVVPAASEDEIDEPTTDEGFQRVRVYEDAKDGFRLVRTSDFEGQEVLVAEDLELST